jgi:hypothetical protein
MPNLYWIGAVDAFWKNPTNWKFNANGSGASPSDYPWKEVNEEVTYLAEYDLIPIGTNQVIIGSFLGAQATGTCSIPNVALYDYLVTGAAIRSGTWTGNGLTVSDSTSILGGKFTGTITVDGGTIRGGTFSGDALVTGTDGQGNTTLSIGSGTPTYSFPTPASGGGGGLDVGQLIGLPAFIKL